MKQKFRLQPDLKGILLGAVSGSAFFLCVSLITALLLTKSDISFHTIKYVCFGATVVSSFLAGFIAKKKARLKGILAGLLSSSVLVAAVFIILVTVNRCRFGEDAYLLIPSGLLFGVLGGIISSNMR